MRFFVATFLLWSVAASPQWFTVPDHLQTVLEIPDLAQPWARVAQPWAQVAQPWAQFGQFWDDVHPRTTDEFSEKVAQLVTSTRMSEQRLQDLPLVLYHLELLITSQWPGSIVVPYGSIVFGLATAKSDIDYSVFLPLADLNHSSQELVRRATTLLMKHPQFFKDFYRYPIQVPVVAFTHVPTNFRIDLTFNNHNAVQDTSLFSYLLRLDPRVYRLSFVAKRWAKAQGITGFDRLPSYGLVLLVMFYLQQVNMVPSIATLQASAEPFLVNEWNSAFTEIQYYNAQNAPLNELLGGFFDYYVNFDFHEYIISPFSVYPIEKRRFSNISKVPHEFVGYVHNVKANISAPLSLERDFVLQDVFIHNDNVANFLDTQPNSTFITQFRLAAKKFRENEIKFIDDLL